MLAKENLMLIVSYQVNNTNISCLRAQRL